MWKTLEGVGDRTLHSIFYEMFQDLRLPFPILVPLERHLNENEMWLSWSAGIPDVQDFPHGEKRANAYEVTSPQLRISDDDQVWNRLAEQDPLYLFTPKPFREMVSKSFSQSLLPLFRYLEAKYGPAFQFNNGSRIDDFSFPIPRIPNVTFTDGGQFIAPNFWYQEQLESVDQLPFWKSLKINISKYEPGRINRSLLTVTVPNDESHPYWSGHAYNWDPRAEQTDFYQFVVEKWGGSQADANWRVTMLAMEIIRCARGGGMITLPLPHQSLQNCPILEYGRDLYNLFKDNPEPFLQKDSKKFWRKAIAILKSMIDKSSPTDESLLRYYKVQANSCASHTSDLPLTFTETQSFPLWRMGLYEAAISELKVIEAEMLGQIASERCQIQFAKLVKAARERCERGQLFE